MELKIKEYGHWIAIIGIIVVMIYGNEAGGLANKGNDLQVVAIKQSVVNAIKNDISDHKADFRELKADFRELKADMKLILKKLDKVELNP